MLIGELQIVYMDFLLNLHKFYRTSRLSLVMLSYVEWTIFSTKGFFHLVYECERFNAKDSNYADFHRDQEHLCAS